MSSPASGKTAKRVFFHTAFIRLTSFMLSWIEKRYSISEKDPYCSGFCPYEHTESEKVAHTMKSMIRLEPDTREMFHVTSRK